MASLADLFASTTAPNANDLRMQAVAPVKEKRANPYGEGNSFSQVVGKIGDILAALGGNEPVYLNSIQAQEKRARQQQQEEALSRVGADPANAEARRNYLAAGGDVQALQALTPKQPNPVSPSGEMQLYAEMVRQGFTPQDALAKLLDFRRKNMQVIGGATDNYVLGPDGQPQPLGTGIKPPAPIAPSYQAVPMVDAEGNPTLGVLNARSGQVAPTPYAPIPKGTGGAGGQKAGAQTPEETLSLIGDARTALNNASSGGIRGAATAGAEMLGISTGRGKADAQLNVVGARLAATVPRFEGPQSDKDTASYRAAAADVANRNLSTETRQAALDIVEEITRRQAAYRRSRPAGGGPARNAMPTATGPNGQKAMWNGKAWVAAR